MCRSNLVALFYKVHTVQISFMHTQLNEVVPEFSPISFSLLMLVAAHLREIICRTRAVVPLALNHSINSTMRWNALSTFRILKGEMSLLPHETERRHQMVERNCTHLNKLLVDIFL